MSASIFEKAADFHGHLGPYLAIGVKMGLLAKKLLGCDGLSGMRVLAKTGSKPPKSCVVDGIQVSTKCTLGKGNIEVADLGELVAEFWRGEKGVEIRVREAALERIAKLLSAEEEAMEQAAREVMELGDEELFEVVELEK